MKIQEEVRKNPHKFKIEEIRKKEVIMDINQQKEPEISWKLPPKIKLEEEIENELSEHGKDSQQKGFIEELCASELKVYYFDEVPEPTEMEKKLFSFTDENIPKIENSQKATKTNDVTIGDVLKFWDNLGNNITKENLRQLEGLLGKVIDIDNETKQQILEQAQKKYEQEIINNQNYLNQNNNININNNLTINNNQRLLSMSNYPNLMNFNSLNQVTGDALSLQNNQKPNLDQINYLNQGLSNQVQTQNNANNQNTSINQKYQEMIQQQSSIPGINTNINNNVSNIINPFNNLNNINFSGYDPNLNAISQLSNFQQQQISNNSRTKSNIDQRMFMESAQRMDVRKYKTKPCRNYHSSTGCTRGENCFFIHDPNFQGREIPNFNPRNYESRFPIQIPGIISTGIGLPQIPNLTPQLGNQFNPMSQLGINPMNLSLNLQQLMGLNGNMNNNLNKNINKNSEEEFEQFGQNNIANTGMIQNNIDNNVAINVGLNNGLLNRQVMEQGMKLQGYDFNYGVGIQGQNVNQNNSMLINAINSHQTNGL